MATLSGTSSRERYLTTFKHQEPDRVPIFLDLHPPFFGSNEVKFYNSFERAHLFLKMGCDPMVNIWLPDAAPHPDVTVKTWREKKDDGEIYLGKEFNTPKGVLRQVVHETEDWCDSTHGDWVQRTLGTTLREEYGIHVFDDWNISRRTEPWIKGPGDLPALRYLLQKPAAWQLDEWLFDAQRAVEFAEKNQLLTMVRRTIVCDAFQWFCDIPWFMIQLYDCPEFVEEFFSIFEEVADWQTELALGVKPDVFQHRDWYGGSEFWGGGHFAKYLAPVINRQADVVHQAGTLHCYLLTEAWEAYEDIFPSLRTDILWGADPVKSNIDFMTMKERFGKEKTLLGGISSEQNLTGCTEEETREATREAIRILAPGGGFVLGSSSSVWKFVCWDNVMAMIDETQRKGRYPIE